MDLKTLRKAVGMTQAQLGEALGVTRQTVASLERDNGWVEQVARLARALGVQPGAFFEAGGDAPRGARADRAEDDEMGDENRVVLPRTGDREVTFTGELVTEQSSREIAGREATQWHRLELYRRDRGGWVLSIRYRSQWEGEPDQDDVLIAETDSEMADLARFYDPTRYLIGSPERKRQDRQRRDLSQRWAVVLGNILAELEPEDLDIEEV